MSHRHLSRDDRVRLAVLLRTGSTFVTIAKLLEVDPTSIGREVNSNGGRSGYSVRRAQARADENRRAANQCHRKLGRDQDLTETVKFLLKLDWSPEQISGRMKLEVELGLIAPELNLTSAQTIYSYVNPDVELSKLLPRGHSKYRRKHGAAMREKKRKELERKRNISTRESAVEKRTRLGDWEGDTMVGKEKRERLLTNVERKSGYLLASKTNSGEAEEIRKAAVADFRKIPASKKHTLTLDNGLEHSEWELTESRTGLKVYFANPYHSWERGTNENTNGLIRRYFPKGTSFAKISHKQVATVVYRLNHRPRKRLGYKTPFEVFNETAIRTLI